MKLFLFDVDGTIVDSQNVIVASTERAFAKVGLVPPSREQTLSIVGLSLPNAMAVLVGADGPIDELVESYKASFTEFRTSAPIAAPLFDGAQELIEAMARRDDVMLGIATGKARRGVNHMLDHYGWHSLFATIQTADDAASKPDPEMIQRALSETGVTPENLVMTGDTTYDMEMAVRAGVRSVGVAWGYHPNSALQESGAERIVDSYAELGTVLDGFIGHGNLNA